LSIGGGVDFSSVALHASGVRGSGARGE